MKFILPILQIRRRGLLSVILWACLLSLACLSFERLLLAIYSSRRLTPSPMTFTNWVNLTPGVWCGPQTPIDLERLWSYSQVHSHSGPPKPVSVLFFSAMSPFHDAPHLLTPSSMMERKQIEITLVAALHGLVSHLIWIYPSWLPNSVIDYHKCDKYQLGLAIINTSNVHGTVGSWTMSAIQGADFVIPESRLVTTICICPSLRGANCSLPLLYRSFLTVTPDACTQNSSLSYERIIDILAESLLSESSAAKEQLRSGQSSAITECTHIRSWFSERKVFSLYPPSVVVIKSSYFASEPSPMPENPVIENPQLIQRFADRVHSVYETLRRSMSSPYLDALFGESVQFIDQAFIMRSSHDSLLSFSAHSASKLVNTTKAVYVNDLHVRFWSTRDVDLIRWSTCIYVGQLYEQLLHAAMSSGSVIEEMLALWHWVCNLDDKSVEILSHWSACVRGNEVGLRTMDLCERSQPQHPFHRFNRDETSMLFDRLDSILRQLPVFHSYSYLSDSTKSTHLLEQICTFLHRLRSDRDKKLL